MKRLLRWAFNGAAVVSALLFVVTCAMWVRSYWVVDEWMWNRSSVSTGHATVLTLKVMPRCGGFSFSKEWLVSRNSASFRQIENDPPDGFAVFSYPQFHLGSIRDNFGFAYYNKRTTDVRWDSTSIDLQLPAWLLVLFLRRPVKVVCQLAKERGAIFSRLCPCLQYRYAGVTFAMRGERHDLAMELHRLPLLATLQG